MKTSHDPIGDKTPSEGELSPEMKNLTVPKVSSAEAATTRDSKNPLPSSPDQPSDFLLQLGIRSHQYVNDFIKLADQKAAFVFALSTAILMLFYKASVQSKFVKPLQTWSLLDGLYFLAVCLLIVSAFLAFLVVKPRLKPSKPSGLIFWESVAKFDNTNEYFGKILGLNQQGVLQELFDHHYRLSQVCKRKYAFLNASVFVCGVGVIVSLFLIIFSS